MSELIVKSLNLKFLFMANILSPLVRFCTHIDIILFLTFGLVRIPLSGFIYKSVCRLGKQQKGPRAFSDRLHRSIRKLALAISYYLVLFSTK